jgi:hypothetical protein
MNKAVLTNRRTKYLGVLATLLFLGAFVLLPSSAMAASDICRDIQDDSGIESPEPNEGGVATAPNCRYGVTASEKGATALAAMKIGWVVTFRANEPDWLPSSVAHTPMIRLKQDRNESGARLDTYTASPSFTENGLGRLIRANPGAVWIVGNEVDRVFWQDDLMPEIYAVAYHDAYHFIKRVDPTAKVAVSGLVLVSPGRLQYLDKVLEAYRQRYSVSMPVDVWTFHAYIFPERNEEYNNHPDGGKPVFASVANGTDPAIAIKNPLWIRPLEERLALCQRDDFWCIYEHDNITLFSQQVIAMRTWMKTNGYQYTPLLLTEWSLLHSYKETGNGECEVRDEQGNCFAPQRVTRFMEDSVQYLENAIDPNLGYPLDGNRLVQQWAWFLLDDMDLGDFIAGNPSLLLNPATGVRTQMGNKYRDLIQQSTTQPNLLIEQVYADLVDVDPQSGAAVATLRVRVRNNGNTPTAAPFEVIFFRDSGLTQEIGRATVPAGLDGCAVNDVVAQIEWNDLEEGVHPYWVEVDAENAVGAAQPPAPKSSVVLVNPIRLFLPTLQR